MTSSSIALEAVAAPAPQDRAQRNQEASGVVQDAGPPHWPRDWLPTTMAGLVVAGALLAAIPLLLAMLVAGIRFQQLAQRSEALVEQGITATRLGADLRDAVAHLERNVRQYDALRDEELLQVFDGRWRSAEYTLNLFAAQGITTTPYPAISRLRSELADTREAWTRAVAAGHSLLPIAERIHELSPQIEALIAASRSGLDARMLALRASTAEARQLLMLSVLTLLPLTAVLALLFSRIVTRPMRRLARAIAALGSSRYGQPITIAYPREMQRLAEQLDWLRRRLSQLEADKDRFLRHVSHELKTPLASLHEGASLLRDGAVGALSPRQQEVSQILVEAVAELEELIENLLSYAAWREDRRKCEQRWFEARPLLEEVLATHRLRLEQRQIEAVLALESGQLHGSRAQWRVALDNLLTNAIKHAPPRTRIEIHAGLRSDAAGDACFLHVRDHGRGVADREKEAIFEPFVRGSDPEESGIRGTGVGLSIVRETVQAHGGRVHVEDAGPGARFVLVWPCAGRA